MAAAPGSCTTRSRRWAGVVALLLLAAPAHGLAQASDQERIDAVSEFLLERAKANLLYVFERRIAEDRAVQCYFPTIYGYVRDGDLRLLLKSRAFWGQTIQSDLKTLAVRAVARSLGQTVDFGRAAMTATDHYNELAQYLSVRYQGKEYPLAAEPMNPPDELRTLIEGYWQVNALRDLMLEADRRLKDVDPVCGLPKVGPDDARRFGEALTRAIASLAAWRRHIRTHMSALTLDLARLERDCGAKPDRWVCAMRKQALDETLGSLDGDMTRQAEAAHAFVTRLNGYLDGIETARKMKEGRYTAQVVLTIELLKTNGADDELIDSFKRYILFFAELADANSAAEIKQTLDEYTMPPVSFAAKREKYTGHVFITAYVGIAGGRVTNAGSVGSDNRKGVYAPIGLEVSRGLASRDSISVLVAPLDFGYPVSLKLNGVKGEIRTSDISAPSVAVTFGFADYPVAVGLAYQWGRRDAALGVVERRALLFVGFDMPLLPLY